MESVVGWLLKCFAVYFIYHEVDLVWQLPAPPIFAAAHLVSAVICLSWPCYKIMCKCPWPFFPFIPPFFVFVLFLSLIYLMSCLGPFMMPSWGLFSAFFVFGCSSQYFVVVWGPFTLRVGPGFIINVCAQFLN